MTTWWWQSWWVYWLSNRVSITYLLKTKPNHEFVRMTEASLRSVPWWLLDSWPSANESGSFQTPAIFRLWVQNPQCNLSSDLTPNHTPDQPCEQICVYVHHGELFPSMWSEREHVWPLHVWLQPQREEMGFYSAMAFPGRTGNGKEMQREKEERRESNFVRFHHLSESLHTKHVIQGLSEWNQSFPD